MLHGFDARDYLASKRRFSLRERPTRVNDLYESDDHFQAKLRGIVEAIAERQDALYASRTWSLLLIFQGMDAAGKDGAIKNVLSGVNPQGCKVASFKKPSDFELDHDFLWRVHNELPRRGQIGVFNRSYYEEVLVPRVYPEVLQAQRLPGSLALKKKIWRERFDDIRWFEEYLSRQGTRVLKFFLHVSKQEQGDRLISRLRDPARRWKFDSNDMSERERWKDYRKAYEDCISATHSERSPWYVIPADDKRNARLMISQIVLDSLRALKLERPTISAPKKLELQKAERALRQRRNR